MVLRRNLYCHPTLDIEDIIKENFHSSARLTFSNDSEELVTWRSTADGLTWEQRPLNPCRFIIISDFYVGSYMLFYGVDPLIIFLWDKSKTCETLGIISQSNRGIPKNATAQVLGTSD